MAGEAFATEKLLPHSPSVLDVRKAVHLEGKPGHALAMSAHDARSLASTLNAAASRSERFDASKGYPAVVLVLKPRV